MPVMKWMSPGPRPIPPARPGLTRCLLASLLGLASALGVLQVPAADAPVERVTLRASYRVAAGKLQIDYRPEEATNLALVKLYGSTRLSQTYTQHVLAEINSSLASLQPIADWKATIDDADIEISRLIDPTNAVPAREFSGTLEAWWNRFLLDRANAGTSFEWRPPRPQQEAGPEGCGGDETLSLALSSATTSLIGHIDATPVSATGVRDPVLRLHLHRPEPIPGVRIVGMAATDAPDGTAIAGEDREKRALERELARA